MDKRQVKSNIGNNKKQVNSAHDASVSTDRETLVWSFDRIDKNGTFKFELEREDMEHKELLYYMMQYSARTWDSIKKDTHDGGKSKHHYLGYDSLCKHAQDRIRIMQIEDIDIIYSLALTNKLRIIGLRDGRVFRAVWFDPEHEFCPVEY